MDVSFDKKILIWRNFFTKKKGCIVENETGEKLFKYYKKDDFCNIQCYNTKSIKNKLSPNCI